MVDVQDHELVPDHELLDEDELDAVLDEYGVKRTDLPKIKRTDAAVKSLDPAAGDVVKIVRDSRTTDTAVTYRLVVE